MLVGKTSSLNAIKGGMTLQRPLAPAVADVTLSTLGATPNVIEKAPKFLKSFLNIPDNNKGDK